MASNREDGASEEIGTDRLDKVTGAAKGVTSVDIAEIIRHHHGPEWGEYPIPEARHSGSI